MKKLLKRFFGFPRKHGIVKPIISLEALSDEELYRLGKKIGEISKERPDITHRIILGIRDGMTGLGFFNGYGLGEILWSLWRHWNHRLKNPDNPPPVPFVMTYHGSGEGKV